jgi:hypothetical protein
MCISMYAVHFLCLTGRVYVFYAGHVDKSSLCEILLHCNILSKHHHHHHLIVRNYDDNNDNDNDDDNNNDNGVYLIDYKEGCYKNYTSILTSQESIHT